MKKCDPGSGRSAEGKIETKCQLACLMSVIEISCLEVWREISNFIDGEIAPELRARMEGHFKSCAHCAAVLDGTRNVVKLVADGVEYDLPEDFSQRLYKRIKDQ